MSVFALHSYRKYPVGIHFNQQVQKSQLPIFLRFYDEDVFKHVLIAIYIMDRQWLADTIYKTMQKNE